MPKSCSRRWEKNVMVYCVKGCRKIRKQDNRKKIIIEESENIVESAKKYCLSGVTGQESRPKVAEQIVLTDSRYLVEEHFGVVVVVVVFSRRCNRKGRFEICLYLFIHYLYLYSSFVDQLVISLTRLFWNQREIYLKQLILSVMNGRTSRLLYKSLAGIGWSTEVL